ncbi:DMT family transporter [Neptunicella marina]|uniref:EamA family transporter n=1 Tax=Neptunicella marina TaxID=2125989 RepID=A0A8J6LZV9_9ALTE|nr:EamA family transporter [Neptunicella marina]MBC3766490.1 EamA family transporter [Neptunicella marina]
MSNPLLFFICVVIWGSTWIAITFQLGDVPPIVSVALRFSIAALVLLAFCLVKRLPMRLPVGIHLRMALVGFCLYTLDYTLLYHAEHYIISALVAVLSSSIIYINVVLRRALLGKPMRMEVIQGASVGLLGVILIFWPEFAMLQENAGLWLGISFAAASFFFAASGNVVSEQILDRGTPVVQMNFWAMTYGIVFTSSYALIMDLPFSLPSSHEYWWSLIYLAVFGSVFAFGAYMRLVQQIGSDKAAYVVLMYPVVSLILSTLYEGYVWHWQAGVGVLCILLGNAIAMGKLKRKTPVMAAG